MSHPLRVNVLDTYISACDEENALAVIAERLQQRRGGYVCFANVHTVVTGRSDPLLQSIINGSLLSVADGRPVFWVGRKRVGARMGHVPGPDFFLSALERFRDRRHFLYGSTPEVLRRLTENLRHRIPGLNICGALSPPFRRLSDSERAGNYALIRASRAEFVWVGLGAPKQEQWMAEAWEALQPCILFGVGAAFDFHAGTLQRAPVALQRLGLEWLYRLACEPRRLWKRYFVTNSLFLYYVARDMLYGRRSPD